MMRRYYLPVVLSFFLMASCGGGGLTVPSENIMNDTVHLSDTLTQLNEQILNDPKNPDILHRRAAYYLHAGNYQKSFEDIMQVLNLDSSKATYYLTLSDVYFYTNKTGASKRALEKAVELDEKNVEALLKLAELYLYVKKHDQSIEYINKALKIDQYNAKAYFMKGMNYKDIQDTAKAISSMQTAVEQDQNYYHAYMQMGILSAARKNPIAIQYYKNAIRIQPNSTEAWYAIGKFYQDAGDWENAITTYNALITANAKNKNAHYNLGAIYLIQLKKYKEAISHFSEAIQMDSTYTEAYYGRGLAYRMFGNVKEAITDYQQCLRINPDYEPAKTELKLLIKLN